MLFTIIRHDIMTEVGKIHDNVFPKVHCQENLRLLSATSLRLNSEWAHLSWVLLTDTQVKQKTVKFNAENTTVGLRLFTENQNNNTVKLCDED